MYVLFPWSTLLHVVTKSSIIIARSTKPKARPKPAQSPPIARQSLRKIICAEYQKSRLLFPPACYVVSSVYLSVSLSVCLFICFSVYTISKKGIQRIFMKVCWQVGHKTTTKPLNFVWIWLTIKWKCHKNLSVTCKLLHVEEMNDIFDILISLYFSFKVPGRRNEGILDYWNYYYYSYIRLLKKWNLSCLYFAIVSLYIIATS